MSENQIFFIRSPASKPAAMTSPANQYLLASRSIKLKRKYTDLSVSTAPSTCVNHMLNFTTNLKNTASLTKISIRSKSYKKDSKNSESALKDKDLLKSLKHKADLIEKSPTLREQYEQANEIFEDLIKLLSPEAKFLGRIKAKISEYILHLETESKAQQNSGLELQEVKQTLKILKKRFQKLAFENLDLNNLIKENENNYTREKLKRLELKKNASKDREFASNMIIKLQNEIADLKKDSLSAKFAMTQLRPQLKAFHQLMKEAKQSISLDKDWKEKLSKIASKLKTVKLNGHDIDHSIEFNGDENSLIIASTASKVNSFFSCYDIEEIF